MFWKYNLIFNVMRTCGNAFWLKLFPRHARIYIVARYLAPFAVVYFYYMAQKNNMCTCMYAIFYKSHICTCTYCFLQHECRHASCICPHTASPRMEHTAFHG